MTPYEHYLMGISFGIVIASVGFCTLTILAAIRDLEKSIKGKRQ